MQSFEVRGGKKLSGDITPQGAKNEALQIISAVLLTPEKVTIKNIPDIIDVNLLIELLGEMNVKIIAITDEPIATLVEARLLRPGEVGEIVVRGPTCCLDAL